MFVSVSLQKVGLGIQLGIQLVILSTIRIDPHNGKNRHQKAAFLRKSTPLMSEWI